MENSEIRVEQRPIPKMNAEIFANLKDQQNKPYIREENPPILYGTNRAQEDFI